ncbi:O-6-methylguanine DNA methyltransferase [Salirhabdus euzebyi]|uniref:Methylated-DNA--protein-cysteine methyltransferase n=1 Tax=Salirhabdus euzebyi TaxID=394506 RepID=A0A841PS47_9BACI|nr:methylated-DNA--[protein]-cysteine S-methyltransferase [Salirhabdus euzebyi]MBB6451757.1 O-6-methylguanine DNA methyltransferase [Salirhabdus euzebyi]
MNKHSLLYISEIETPVGTMTLIGNDMGICQIDFGTKEEQETKLKNWAKKHFLCANFETNSEKLVELEKQLQEYFAGERKEFNVPYQFYGTPFQKKVWNALLNIPYGETRSYKDIAHEIKSPKAVRAVGGAVNKNPLSVIVPCHRVIGSNGALVGYNGGLDKKEFLLKHENIPISQL